MEPGPPTRVANGGAPIKVRVVKGANLAMEQVDAEQHGWVQAPYPTKADTDASYKRLLDSCLRPEWAGAIRLGVASHNLFDVAWALTLRDDLPESRRGDVDIEMLEGMVPAQTRAVRERAGTMLLYCPIVRDDEIEASLAYLARRFDENTAPENFLRAMFTMRPGRPSSPPRPTASASPSTAVTPSAQCGCADRSPSRHRRRGTARCSSTTPTPTSPTRSDEPTWPPPWPSMPSTAAPTGSTR